VEERCVYIDKIVAGLKARTDEMGTAIAREVGMPIKMAKMIQVGGPIFNWGNAAKAARRFSLGRAGGQFAGGARTDWRGRLHHALEFPFEPNHIKSRACAWLPAVPWFSNPAKLPLLTP
jgi:hypothetical protein